MGLIPDLGEKRNAYRILVWKPEGKRLFRTPRRSSVCNIKMEIKVMEWKALGVFYLLRIEINGGLL